MAKDKSPRKPSTPTDEADPRIVPVIKALGRTPGFSLMESRSGEAPAPRVKIRKPRRAPSSPSSGSAEIDRYLAAISADKRTALEKLRRTIRSIVPEAEECISYRIPAFRVGGAVVAGFCARANGCSYFPFSGTTLRTLAADLAAYGGTKSALHFDPAVGLPKALVRKLLEARIAEKSSR